MLLNRYTETLKIETVALKEERSRVRGQMLAGLSQPPTSLHHGKLKLFTKTIEMILCVSFVVF